MSTTMLLEPQSEPAKAEGARLGEIYRITPVGMCYLADRTTDEVFCCTFGKFKGYRGEYPVEFGMFPGSPVHFLLDEDGHVAWVELL